MDLRQKSATPSGRQTKADKTTNCHLLPTAGTIVNNLCKTDIPPELADFQSLG